MDAAVVIELTEDPPELAAALLDACSHGPVRGGCVSVGTAPAAASIRWTEGRLAAHVRVVDVAHSDIAQEEDVPFGASDALAERYRAVGLVIALLTEQVHHAREARESTPPPPPPRSPEPPKEPPIVVREREWAIDLAFATGPSLNDGTWQLGPLGRVTWSPRRWAFVEADVRAGFRPTDDRGVSLQTTSSVLGVGLAFTTGRLRIAGRLQGGFAWFRAAVTDPINAERDAAATVVPVARLGLDASVRLAPPLAIFLGVDAGAHIDLPITLRNAEVGSVPPWEVWLSVGIRFLP
jgi:hypothetical protein